MIKLIRKIVSYFSLYYYRLFLKQTKFYIGTHSIILAKFRVKGKKNFIEFGNGCTIRKTRIQINGNNNRISFADNVKVYEKLKILIESNDCIIHIGNNTTVG